jgi:hypothetical protein
MFLVAPCPADAQTIVLISSILDVDVVFGVRWLQVGARIHTCCGSHHATDEGVSPRETKGLWWQTEGQHTTLSVSQAQASASPLPSVEVLPEDVGYFHAVVIQTTPEAPPEFPPPPTDTIIGQSQVVYTSLTLRPETETTELE